MKITVSSLAILLGLIATSAFAEKTCPVNESFSQADYCGEGGKGKADCCVCPPDTKWTNVSAMYRQCVPVAKKTCPVSKSFSQADYCFEGGKGKPDCCVCPPDTKWSNVSAMYRQCIPVATPEEACFEAVQGKVAWNQAGSKQWDPANVQRLCAGTTDPAATIACFQAQIAKHDNWVSAIDACKPDAVK